MQAQLAPTLWTLLMDPSPGPRRAAALLAGAVAPSLGPRQVARQVVPALAVLAADCDGAVRGAAFAAAATLFHCLASDVDEQEGLLGALDDVLDSQGLAAELAALRALAPVARSPQQLHWLLRRLRQMLGASGAGPSPPSAASSIEGTPASRQERRSAEQRVEVAAAAFLALRQLEAVEYTDAVLHGEYIASLRALQAQAALLEAPARQVLSSMLADHQAAAAPAAAAPAAG